MKETKTMMPKHLKKTALALALMPLLTVSGNAVSESFVLEELIVTSQKRQENIQNVGIAITAFSGDQMRELGQINAKDVAAQSPGVVFSDAGQSMTNILNIRGVSQNDFLPHQESPNAIYIDEVYMSILPASNFSVFDMERVEILRGPQGTMYGRNATGGLIHYITAKPSENFEGFIDVTLGENKKQRVEAAVGGAVADSVSGRVAFVMDKNDGWLDNNAGDDMNEVDTYSARGSLLFDINEDSQLLLSTTHGGGDKNQAYGHTSSGFDLTTFLEIPIAGIDYYGLGVPGGDSTGYVNLSNDETDIEVDGESYYEPELHSYTATYSYEPIEGITFTSITNYTDWEVAYAEDSEASPRIGINTFIESETQQFSQEFRIGGDTETMSWTAGLYYLNIDHETDQISSGELGYLDDLFAVLGLTALGDLDGDPTFGQTIFAYDDLVSNYTQETSTIGIFAQSDFDITDELSLITGLRYGKDEKEFKFNSREYYASSAIGANDGLETTALPAFQVWGTTSADRKQTEEDWSGKLQLDWQFSYDTLVYIGASKGVKGGGFTAPTFGGTVNEFDQETLYSYEMGIKSSLNESTRLNISVFSYDYKDYQAFTFVNLNGLISNQDATINGAEVELVWNAAEGLTILLGASVMDAEVEDMGLPGGQIVDRDMPMAPDFTYNALVRKSWEVGENEFAVQLDYNYTDSYFSEALNNPSSKVDAHGIANARISYGPADNNWEVALNVRNLTDEDESPYHIPTGLGFSEDAVASPRWVSAQLLYRFD